VPPARRRIGWVMWLRCASETTPCTSWATTCASWATTCASWATTVPVVADVTA